MPYSTVSDIARTIVDDIVSDIEARSGLGDEWDGVDGSVQMEILDEWAEIVQYRLDKMKK